MIDFDKPVLVGNKKAYSPASLERRGMKSIGLFAFKKGVEFIAD